MSVTSDHTAAGAAASRWPGPTDTTAIAELEHVAQCEIDISALPLSTVEELVERSYKGITTAITVRGGSKLTTGRRLSGVRPGIVNASRRRR